MSTLPHPGVIEVGAIWFAGLGFRPAVETPPHRVDHVDPARLVPAPDADAAYHSKYDLPVTLDAADEGHGFGFVAWPSGTPQITAASLAAPAAGPIYGSLRPSPWWPVDPLPPIYPCNCITVPPTQPELPPVAPVPVPATAGLLLLAIAALFIARRKP